MDKKEKSIIDLIISSKEWLRFLLSKWKLIVAISFLGSCLGVCFSLLIKPTYAANLTFALEEKSNGANGIGAIASQFGLSIGGSEGGAFTGDNIIELLKSRYIIEKTLLSKVTFANKEELLVNMYIKFNKLNESWAGNPMLINLNYTDLDRTKFSFEQDSVLGEISKGISENLLSVKKIDKKLSIVSVNVTSNNEVFSKYFCESLVKNVAIFYIETKTAKSRANISLLQYRVDSVKKELDAAMYGRAQFSDQNLGLIRQSAAVPRIKQEMRVQMLGTMYGELIKNLEFSKLALMREEPLIQIIDSPILPLVKKRFSKFKGIIFGGAFLGLLTVFALVINKLYVNLLIENNSNK
jgi:hypothetical protein